MRIETKKSRGGNHGGGTTVKTVVLTDQAAAYVKPWHIFKRRAGCVFQNRRNED
jgi:hypothetical protein